MPVQDLDHLDIIRRESSALLTAAEEDLTAPVPSCPAWTAADLVWHIAEVHHRWAAVAREGWTTQAEADAGYERPGRPADDQLVTLAASKAMELVDALDAVAPDAPRWNWSAGEQTAGWIRRRMAVETAVHRLDAELAAGRPTPIEPRLAADGIDEMLTVFLPGIEQDLSGPKGVSVIVETDFGNAWAVKHAPPTAKLVGPGDLTSHDTEMERVWGTASEMLLLLWGRAERVNAGPTVTALLEHLRAR